MSAIAQNNPVASANATPVNGDDAQYYGPASPVHGPPSPLEILASTPTTSDTLLAQSPATDPSSTEALAQSPTTAEQLVGTPNDAGVVSAYEKPNILNLGLDLGRDNRVELGLFSSSTVDGLLETPKTISINDIELSSAGLTNAGDTYRNIGIGRSSGGINDQNGFPNSNSPTDTRTDGVTGFSLGVATLGRPSESTVLDVNGFSRTTSANHLTLGPNLDPVRIPGTDVRPIQLNGGIIGGLVGTEGTDPSGRTNYADIQLQIGLGGSGGAALPPLGRDGLEVDVLPGVGVQVISGVGVSAENINPDNIAPVAFDADGKPVGERVLPDRFSYNADDRTIIDWSSWFKNTVYDADGFDPANPGEPLRTEFPGVRESAGRFTFEVLEGTGLGLIDVGSRTQQLNNETFAELDKAPELMIDSYKRSGAIMRDSFVESIKGIPDSLRTTWDGIVDAVAEPWRR